MGHEPRSVSEDPGARPGSAEQDPSSGESIRERNAADAAITRYQFVKVPIADPLDPFDLGELDNCLFAKSAVRLAEADRHDVPNAPSSPEGPWCFAAGGAAVTLEDFVVQRAEVLDLVNKSEQEKLREAAEENIVDGETGDVGAGVSPRGT